MTNALRQIEKGFLLLIMTPPQPQNGERVDDNMSGNGIGMGNGKGYGRGYILGMGQKKQAAYDSQLSIFTAMHI